MLGIFWVGLGGAVGAVARYLLSNIINKSIFINFPIATLLINILGCTLIGFFYYLFHKDGTLSPALKLFLMTGFCGGFTTFSTFSLEQWQLFEAGNYARLIIYGIGSMVLGFGCLSLGFYLGKISS